MSTKWHLFFFVCWTLSDSAYAGGVKNRNTRRMIPGVNVNVGLGRFDDLRMTEVGPGLQGSSRSSPTKNQLGIITDLSIGLGFGTPRKQIFMELGREFFASMPSNHKASLVDHRRLRLKFGGVVTILRWKKLDLKILPQVSQEMVQSEIIGSILETDQTMYGGVLELLALQRVELNASAMHSTHERVRYREPDTSYDFKEARSKTSHFGYSIGWKFDRRSTIALNYSMSRTQLRFDHSEALVRFDLVPVSMSNTPLNLNLRKEALMISFDKRFN